MLARNAILAHFFIVFFNISCVDTMPARFSHDCNSIPSDHIKTDINMEEYTKFINILDKQIERDMEKTSFRTKGEWSRFTKKQDERIRQRINHLGIDKILEYANIRFTSVKPYSNAEHIFFRGIIIYLFESGDRKNLVQILSNYCPSSLYFYPFEFYLVTWKKSKIKDPIMILFDAYSASAKRETKEKIVFLLRRAFANLNTKNVNSNVFIRQCRQWYLQNKSDLKVNLDYPIKVKFRMQSELFISKNFLRQVNSN